MRLGPNLLRGLWRWAGLAANVEKGHEGAFGYCFARRAADFFRRKKNTAMEELG